MLSSSLDVLLKLSMRNLLKKLFDYNCTTLYISFSRVSNLSSTVLRASSTKPAMSLKDISGRVTCHDVIFVINSPTRNNTLHRETNKWPYFSAQIAQMETNKINQKLYFAGTPQPPNSRKIIALYFLKTINRWMRVKPCRKGPLSNQSNYLALKPKSVFCLRV